MTLANVETHENGAPPLEDWDDGDEPIGAIEARIPPPRDLDAEAAVLSAALLSVEACAEVSVTLNPEHFYSDANRWIFKAVLDVRSNGRPVDVVTIATWLRDRERLQLAGGTPYLAQLTDAIPHVANVGEHARVVREKWRVRQLIAMCQRFAAEGYTVATDDVEGFEQRLVEAIAGLRGSVVARNNLPGVWLSELGDLSVAPPKRQWLLSDVRTKQKVLRRGKCVVLAADGGVGKSFLWLMLAVCIALGLDLFGVFRPEQPGHVALLMAEDDFEECWDRLYRICNALGLTREQREQAKKRILLYALAGHEVAFLEVDQAQNPRRTAVLESVIGRLTKEAESGGFEWSFVGIDPLARFASGNAESDNSLATAFVQAIESVALRVPGKPAVGVTHHASKAALRAGTADVRGVTGIRNAFRAAFTLTGVTTADLRGVLLENVKNNLAPEAPPLWLVRMGNEPLADGTWLETGGVLRRATDDEVATLDAEVGSRGTATPAQREQAKASKTSDAFKAECDAILALIPVVPAHTNVEAIVAALRAGGTATYDKKVKARLEHLASEGGGRLVVDLSDGSRSKPRQWARPPKGDE